MNSFRRNIYKTSQQQQEEENLISCNESIEASGKLGIYEVEINIGTELGYTGIEYNAFSVPDRFQIFYDGNLVADSKYVGEESYFDELEGQYTLDKLEYNNGEFVDTGIQENITVTSSDIADGSPSEKTSGSGVIYFNRTDRNSNKMIIRVTGILDTTLWNLESICPQEDIPFYSNSAMFAFVMNLSDVDCNSYKTSQNKMRLYYKENSINKGTILYRDEQFINKPIRGYYLFSTRIYYFDGNEITEILNCDINDL